jgi:manganese/zinc/iron transport system permease protein
MTAPQIEIQLVAIAVAVACALPGVFLVLRRMAMMSDAISHTILLGIVLAFFVVEDLASPFLILSAAATGVATVAAVEALHRSGRVREDAAIGLIFPIFFSAAVILIARYAGSIHLDTDAVLLGELAFVPFDRLVVGGLDLGPKALAVMLGIVLLNAAFLGVFYKELKVATFDPPLAAVLGLSPVLLHYALMSVVSITAVGAFQAVGSILVVALMIAPPATAYLITDRLPRMLAWSAGAAVAAALSGYWVAHLLDASIAGSMASMAGVIFLAAFLFAPAHGVLAAVRRRWRQRQEFAAAMLAIHLLSHEDSPEAATECHEDHLGEHLRWERAFASRAVEAAIRDGLIVNRDGHLSLTPRGRQRAADWMIL